MSLTGMYKLSQLDPLTADPAQIKVAIKTDKAILIKDGAVEIKLGYQSDDDTIDIDDAYKVHIDHRSPLAHSLFDQINTNENITVLSLTEVDAKQFRQNQQIISAHKAQDKEGKGFFSLSLNNLCLPTPLPTRQLTADVYMQTQVADGFFKFLSDVDLKEQLEDIKPEELEKLAQACQQS